jgi:hypothetical protein
MAQIIIQRVGDVMKNTGLTDQEIIDTVRMEHPGIHRLTIQRSAPEKTDGLPFGILPSTRRIFP